MNQGPGLSLGKYLGPFVFILSLFMIHGCGIKKLAVKNADHLLYFEVSKEVPLGMGQKKKLRQDIKTFLNDSKKTGRKILNLLNDIDLKNKQKTQSHYLEIEKIYLEIAEKFCLLLSHYLAQLDLKEQEILFSQINHKTNKILNLTLEERKKRGEKRFKNLFGDITKNQIVLLQRYEEYSSQRWEQHIKRRQKIKNQLQEIYQKQNSQDLKQNLIFTALIENQKEMLKDNRNLDFIINLLPTLGEKQLSHINHHFKQGRQVLEYYLNTQY